MGVNKKVVLSKKNLNQHLEKRKMKLARCIPLSLLVLCFILLSAGFVNAENKQVSNDENLVAFYTFDNYQGSNLESFSMIDSHSLAATTYFDDLREIGNVLYNSSGADHLYYTSYSGFSGSYTGTNVYAGIMYSDDGISWTDVGNFTDRSLEDPYIIKLNSTHWILYAEDKGDVPFRNIRAYITTNLSDTSAWVDVGDVLDITSEEWENTDVSSPAVLVEDETIYLIYEARGDGSITGLENGMAVASSTDGLTFTRIAKIVNSSQEDDVTGDYVPDDIIKIGDTYWLTYHAITYSNGDQMGFVYAQNLTDPSNWTFSSRNPFIKSVDTVMFTEIEGEYYGSHRAKTGWTGEIYFGKLVNFTETKLKEDYIPEMYNSTINLTERGGGVRSARRDAVRPSYISHEALSDIDIDKNFSISLRVYVENKTEAKASGDMIIGNGLGSTDRFNLLLDDSYFELAYYNGSYTGVRSDSAVLEEQWYDIAIVNNGTLNLIIDNVQQSGSSTYYSPITSNFFLGGHSSSFMGGFGGIIDDVMIFNDSLTSSEISNLDYCGDISCTPYIYFNSSSDSAGTYSGKNNILMAISLNNSYINFSNITLNLYNSSGLVQSNDSTSGFSINFIELPDDTYYVNATANNSNGETYSIGTSTFVLNSIPSATTEESPTSNGKSGYYAHPFWRNNYREDSMEFVKMKLINRRLKEKERIQILFNEEIHHIGIVDISDENATINVSSDPQQVAISSGNAAKFDIDDDLYYDLRVYVSDISDNAANILISYLHEKVLENTNNTDPLIEEDENLTDENTPESEIPESFLKWIIGGICIIIIISVVVSLKKSSKRRKIPHYH